MEYEKIIQPKNSWNRTNKLMKGQMMDYQEKHFSMENHELLEKAVLVAFCPEDLEYQSDCDKEYEGNISDVGQYSISAEEFQVKGFYIDVNLLVPLKIKGFECVKIHGTIRNQNEDLYTLERNGWITCNMTSPGSQWPGARGSVKLKGVPQKYMDCPDSADDGLTLQTSDSEETVYANETQTLVACKDFSDGTGEKKIDFTNLMEDTNNPCEKFPLEDFIPQIIAFAKKIHYDIEINHAAFSVFLLEKSQTAMPKRIIIQAMWEKDSLPRTLGIATITAMSFNPTGTGAFSIPFLAEIYRQSSLTASALQIALDKAYSLIKDK